MLGHSFPVGPTRWPSVPVAAADGTTVFTPLPVDKVPPSGVWLCCVARAVTLGAFMIAHSSASFLALVRAFCCAMPPPRTVAQASCRPPLGRRRSRHAPPQTGWLSVWRRAFWRQRKCGKAAAPPSECWFSCWNYSRRMFFRQSADFVYLVLAMSAGRR